MITFFITKETMKNCANDLINYHLRLSWKIPAVIAALDIVSVVFTIYHMNDSHYTFYMFHITSIILTLSILPWLLLKPFGKIMAIIIFKKFKTECIEKSIEFKDGKYEVTNLSTQIKITFKKDDIKKVIRLKNTIILQTKKIEYIIPARDDIYILLTSPS